MSVRWKDKDDITALAADDWIPVTDNSDSDTDKHCTPAEIATYVFAAGGTLGTKLTAGATEIEGSAFDINGGTSDDLVINGGSAGSTTPLTKLNVDNIQIDGNTISSTAGTDLNITPLAGQQVVIDGAVTIDAGVVTGVSTLTASTSLTTVALTATGDVGMAGNVYLNCTPQTINGGAAGTILAAVSRTLLISGGVDPLVITMTDGTVDGQLHYVTLLTHGGEDAVISAGNIGFTSITFSARNHGCTLMWDETNQLWYCVGVAGATFAA